jgi:hypothetical protein
MEQGLFDTILAGKKSESLASLRMCLSAGTAHLELLA